MTSIKERTLLILYQSFDDWSENHDAALQPVCKKQCDSCCTQNVTITATEGERILQYIIKQKKEEWFAAALASALEKRGYHAGLAATTNEFASSCFAEKEPVPEEDPYMEQCPFLETGLCQIYEVRPFGCRLFLSSVRCCEAQPAILPEFYIDAATAANQLIEHLCQREYWGNMLDVLAALLDLREYQNIAELVAKKKCRSITNCTNAYEKLSTATGVSY